MKRIPEHDLMDTPEQAIAYASTDFSEPHDAFVKHFQQRFPDFAQGEVLDLGCGAADVTVRFGWAYPRVKIYGVDGAQAMLELGTKAVQEMDMADRITLTQHYLPDAALPSQHFDAIICNSLLHHLDDPLTLWQTVKQTAKPGAPVMVMDLVRPNSVVEVFRLVREHASDAPPILQKDFYHSLLAAYQPQEVKRQLFKMDLDHFSIEIVSDRHMLIWGQI